MSVPTPPPPAISGATAPAAAPAAAPVAAATATAAAPGPAPATAAAIGVGVGDMWTVHVTYHPGYFWLSASFDDDAAAKAKADKQAEAAAAAEAKQRSGGGIFAALGFAKPPPKSKAPPKVESKDARGAALSAFVRVCYDAVLHADPLFHYFFEPDVIFRVSSAAVAARLSAFLMTAAPGGLPVEHTAYRYPSPVPIERRAASNLSVAVLSANHSAKSKAGKAKNKAAANPKAVAANATAKPAAATAAPTASSSDAKSAAAAATGTATAVASPTSTTAAAPATTAAAASTTTPAPHALYDAARVTAAIGGVAADPDAEEREAARIGLPCGRGGVRPLRRYSEEPDGVVLRHLPVFLPLFHAHSVAAITMPERDHRLYMERSVHTMWNPACYTRRAEGEALTRMGAWKLGAVNAITYLEANAATLYDDIM